MFVACERLKKFLESVSQQPANLLKACSKREDTGPASPWRTEAIPNSPSVDFTPVCGKLVFPVTDGWTSQVNSTQLRHKMSPLPTAHSYSHQLGILLVMDAGGQPLERPGLKRFMAIQSSPYLRLKTILKTSQPVNEKDVQDFQLPMKLEGVCWGNAEFNRNNYTILYC